ncbi:MAG: Hpt domain-containing protein [Terriglobia bacterium]
MKTQMDTVLSSASSSTPSSSEPKASPLRIVVAEDNSVNRRIAIQILKNLGHHVTAVSTVHDILGSLSASPCDLLILACHGSDEDVCQVVAEIRKKESGKEHLPIIALTSNTLQCDRKKREALTIDDYIAIPIDPKAMVTVIQRWDKKSGKPSSYKLTAIDRNMIRSIQSIAGEDSAGLLNELIELFLTTSPERIGEMKSALAEQSASKMHRPAHSLKGSCAQMGAVRMQQICSSLEALAKAETLNGVPELLEELQSEMERVTQDLQHIQQETGDDAVDLPEDPAPVTDPGLLSIAPAFKGKKILALDLYPGILSQCQTLLTSFGCQVETISASLF